LLPILKKSGAVNSCSLSSLSKTLQKKLQRPLAGELLCGGRTLRSQLSQRANCSPWDLCTGGGAQSELCAHTERTAEPAEGRRMQALPTEVCDKTLEKFQAEKAL